jgi:hypothetical protein
MRGLAFQKDYTRTDRLTASVFRDRNMSVLLIRFPRLNYPQNT